MEMAVDLFPFLDSNDMIPRSRCVIAEAFLLWGGTGSRRQPAGHERAGIVFVRQLLHA